jgi:hypothetical protein
MLTLFRAGVTHVSPASLPRQAAGFAVLMSVFAGLCSVIGAVVIAGIMFAIAFAPMLAFFIP